MVRLVGLDTLKMHALLDHVKTTQPRPCQAVHAIASRALRLG